MIKHFSSITCFSAFKRHVLFCHQWLWVINVAVLYNLIVVVGRAVFWELDNLIPRTWMVMDYVCDGLYVVDTFIRMHEGYLEQGLLVKKPHLLRQNYFRSRYFPLNVIRYYLFLIWDYINIPSYHLLTI